MILFIQNKEKIIQKETNKRRKRRRRRKRKKCVCVRARRTCARKCVPEREMSPEAAKSKRLPHPRKPVVVNAS